MNTIIDLNVAANITYNQQQDYAIVFGANAGNVTANIDNYTTNGVTKQVSITTLTDPVRDVLVDWQFSNVGVVTMAYTGPWANVSLLPVSPSLWRAYGVRSIAQYDEVMANVKYTDISGGLAPNPDYNYVTTINDQSGNTRTWTTTLNVIANPTISITGNVIYNEDTLANITVANIVVDPGSALTFTLFANAASANGEVSNGVVTSNSVSISGNATQLNTQIQAGAIKFLPASDLVSNVANAITLSLDRAGTTVNVANANIQIANTHNEYSLTTSYNYAEDTTVPMVFQITDLDTHALSYTVTFAQTSGTTGGFYVNGNLLNRGQNAVISNSKANINVANVSFLPFSDDTGNVGLTYSQIKTLPTGNVTQASNVAISLINTSSHSEYNFPATGTYNEDTRYSFGNTISDTDTRAQSYTISLQQTSGNIGQFYRSNVLVGNANTTLTISNSKSNINNTVSWQPPVDYTGNVVFTYSQSKVNVYGNTITQASGVTANLSIGNTNPEISNMTARTVTANTVNSIFATTTPYINDGPDYGQSYTITLSSPVGRFGNTVNNAIASSTYSYTGNITQVNNEFTNMKFVNDYGVGAQTSSFTYTQSRNGVAQVNTSPVLTISAGSIGNTYTRTITGNSTFTPTQDQVLFGNIQIFTVGGGGAGHNNSQTPRRGGGGGGGGSIYNVNAVRGTANALTASTYSVTIGSGGVGSGSSGGNTYFTLGSTTYFLAPGGGGGDDDNGGGSYYNGTLNAGGTGGVTSNNGVGGGGASPASAGDSYTGLNAGDGAPGYVSTISGSSVYYGAGGGGGVYDATGTPNPVPGTGGTGGGGNGSGLAGGGPAGSGTAYGAGGGGGTSTNPGNGYQGVAIIKIS